MINNRELLEETGYKMNKIILDRRKLRLDPWKSKNIFGMVVVDIDGDSPENAKPVQKLEKEEDIKVKLKRFFLFRLINIEEQSKIWPKNMSLK